jgi:signal transduction histidine kinase
VHEILATKTAAKGIALTLTAAPDPSGRLLGEPVRVRQILSNPAENAIKFT